MFSQQKLKTLLKISFFISVITKVNSEGKINCKITRDYLHANCSHRQLNEVPTDLPKTLLSLDLTGNNIEVLSNNSFKHLTLLQNIIIDNNRLLNIESMAFTGLGRLHKLSLVNNNLTYDYETFPVDVFQPLKMLKKLNIYGNKCFENESTHYPDVSFSFLTSLEHLTIDLCKYPIFGKGFKDLHNLKKLEFKQCYLKRLENDTLKVFSGVILELHMTQCLDIDTTVEYGSLEGMERLSVLNMENTRISLPSALRLLYGIQNNLMKIVNFYQVSDQNFFREGKRFAVILTKSMTIYLMKMCIKNLNIGNNGIVEYEKDSLFGFKHAGCLEHFYFSENRFVILNGWGSNEFFQFFTKAKKLRELNFSYMPWKFTRYDNTFNISSSKLVNVFLPCPENLHTINISHVLADANLHYNGTLIGCNTLSVIDFSYTTFEDLYFDFHGLNNVKYIDFSGLDFTKSWPGTLRSCPNVERVIKRETKLDRVLENRHSANIYTNVKKIHNLDISNNHLTDLTEVTLGPLSMLRILNISFNFLSKFPVGLLSKRFLHTIDISSNRLTYLDSKVTTWLDEQANRHKVKLYLNGNRIICSCETMGFIQWLSKTRVHLDQNGDYECFLLNGTITTTTWVINNFSQVFVNCSSQVWLLFSVISSIIITVVLIVSVIIFRLRWRISFLCFLHCLGKKDRNPDLNFKYDIFVGYIEKDYEWVCYDLRNRLEDQMGFKLCLHHRDFDLGESIFNNIDKNISESRFVIFIISPGCINSKWFESEIEIARNKTIQKRFNNIILIIKETTPARLMPPVIRDIWDNISCIIWPQNYPNSVGEIEEFWNRLEEILKM